MTSGWLLSMILMLAAPAYAGVSPTGDANGDWAAITREVDRDPASLRVSVHVWGAADARPGRDRRQRLRAYADLGVDRVILQGFAAVREPDRLAGILDDCLAAGLMPAA